MELLDQLRAYGRVLGRARYRTTPELLRLLARRPAIMAGVAAYETGLVASGRVEGHLKMLAEVKTAALVGCAFCLDIGSAVGREMGVTERQLQELSRYRESDAFSPDERLVLDLAVAMTKAPVEVPPELLERLRERFSEAQLVELTAAIAWEGYRARFNHALGVEAVGFSRGAACALPERGAVAAAEHSGAPAAAEPAPSAARRLATG